MPGDATNRDLLAAWKSGDQQAASVLFDRFQARLLALVRARLSRRLARRIDPEDVLLSAYRSFFVAARNGRVTPTDSDDLWPLLVTMTLRKLARQVRTHSAHQRSVDQEHHDDSEWLRQLISSDPAPDLAALLEDEVESLGQKLSDADREILVQTLQGHDAISIARQLSISDRTVRRTLEKIRQLTHGQSAEFIRISIPSIPWRERQYRIASRTDERGTIAYEQLLLQQLKGIGAFSKVYKALDKTTGDVVAVKFLRRDCWKDSRARESITHEWKSLESLQHVNVLRVRGWGTTPHGGLFLVSDFISGGDLDDWSQFATRSIEEIMDVVTNVAHAIIAAHQVGILHCDLKPSNVLRCDDGQIVVCDFGLSRWVQAPDDIPRGGTAGFLCPEQISDAFGPIGEVSDVYGLGAFAYCLLTGQSPMSGRDLPETLANVLSANGPMPPSSFRQDIKPALESVITRALQKEPGSRFASAVEFVAALSSAKH